MDDRQKSHRSDSPKPLHKREVVRMMGVTSSNLGGVIGGTTSGYSAKNRSRPGVDFGARVDVLCGPRPRPVGDISRRRLLRRRGLSDSLRRDAFLCSGDTAGCLPSAPLGRHSRSDRPATTKAT